MSNQAKLGYFDYTRNSLSDIAMTDKSKGPQEFKPFVTERDGNGNLIQSVIYSCI